VPKYAISRWDAAKIEALFVELFLEAHQDPPKQIILDLDTTTAGGHRTRVSFVFDDEIRPPSPSSPPPVE
jgi:hypothetical protein